ncbi:hypothetical protein [Pedosphaera parvula]|uniref:AbiTii domain-containing protein n=1 Tax=Pedosphaera parvula (strain Ellin514) TaxID=320771 RepID=B9XKC9_PEDPL|nr:hypothetical protein [Pedosphaera parvula]EEF59767.1 hypothetical protein Cflav_PD2588 [Pedosphaera parvula Ellin514]
MGSAVHNLQMTIVEGKQSLTQLLRQTKLIAAKLNLEDVERWVDMELDGYPANTETPPYRDYVTNSLQIHNAYRGGWQFAGNLSIKLKAREPIAQIESHAKAEQVAMASPKRFPIVGDDGLPSIHMTSPQRIVTSGEQFKRIIDAVTNELLRWTTELEKRGIKGEDMNFNEKEKQAAANHFYNYGTVHGAIGNITNSQVTVYDYSSIHQLLIDKQIPTKDRHELENIMDELKDAPAKKKPSLIARGEQWIVKHKEFLGAAGEAIGKAIGAMGNQ